MENKETYKVLVGDPFGGYATVEDGLSEEEAKKLADEVQSECDYFTSAVVKPD